MLILNIEEQYNVDISDFVEVADYTNDDIPRYITLSVSLRNLSGVGGSYAARLYMSAAGIEPLMLLVPDQAVVVPPGEDVRLQSREILLPPGFYICIRVRGLVGDTDVHTRVFMVDTSPTAPQQMYDIIAPAVAAAAAEAVQ